MASLFQFQHRSRQRRPRRECQAAGFSLLEVILALALSVFVIAAIGYAIHLYMLTLTRQQADIERKQVARSVLMMIHNDLRAAIQYKPQDYSGLENLASSQDMIAGAAEMLTGGTGDGTEGGVDSTGGTSESAGDDGRGDAGDDSSGMLGAGGGTGGGGGTSSGADQQQTTSEEEDMSTSRPTMIGNSVAMVIDVSRLPRVDEYNPMVAVDPARVQLPSDVKAICYFFSEQPSQQPDDIIDSVGRVGGLYRRQIDRAVAAYRGDTGISESPDQYTILVAPEIAGVSFRYWDGSDWQDQWDSTESGGFPTAIEVVLKIDPYRVSNPDLAGNEDEIDYYRTVIHLPVAEPELSE